MRVKITMQQRICKSLKLISSLKKLQIWILLINDNYTIRFLNG